MKPKFSSPLAWEQAQVLMQPAYIRILDNIRKCLEESNWKERYEEVQTPLPGYQLCLTRSEREVKINLWELCFRVCFEDYNRPAHTDESEVEVKIDTSLFDEEGDLDWRRIDDKARQVVEQVFAQLS